MHKKTTPNIEKKPSSLRYFQEGPSDINLKNWKLKISGEVSNELSISYDDILKLPKSYFHRRSVCVCLWSIKRHWEGVLLSDVLALAGVDKNDDKLFMKQISHPTDKGVYDSTVHLSSALKRNAILAYEVDGEILKSEQGFPLRFLDFGLFLYKCVKSVSEIKITRENKLGYWEDYAGYDLDGTIQPKRYYAVDLHKKFYFDGNGEVFDHDIE
ncbi:molybdopterin-dependent oxidoreductase [Solimicrobium silvestre]|uniref:Oxidoreductase molybdopterin binding domain n=1 Tax=Solimicrobium silvestre TaxID=2099400 RepID=A0A2S9GX84_9BURK|nr:molybdopterin-dependent oxidoreductase [Solimicrobium silvestre]PRC92332.1 Oxidoreductase molybdopterin binding domain [Solimicrobium silvestre]